MTRIKEFLKRKPKELPVKDEGVVQEESHETDLTYDVATGMYTKGEMSLKEYAPIFQAEAQSRVQAGIAFAKKQAQISSRK